MDYQQTSNDSALRRSTVQPDTGSESVEIKVDQLNSKDQAIRKKTDYASKIEVLQGVIEGGRSADGCKIFDNLHC